MTKSQSRPLIVEWPSADRAALESATRRGLVVVRYLGCEMELLSQCRVAGTYSYTAVTQQTDRVTIRDLDELYASVPLGAAKLEAKLATRGELNVDMTIVGTFGAPAETFTRGQLAGACEGATHVITALSVGAFEFYAGAERTLGGGATIANTGGGARVTDANEMLSRAGRAEACARATTKDTEPPDGCGALLRVEVTRLAPSRATAPPGVPDAGSAVDAAEDTLADDRTGPDPDAGAPPDGPFAGQQADIASPATLPADTTETLGEETFPAADTTPPSGGHSLAKPVGAGPGIGIRAGMSMPIAGLDNEIGTTEMGSVGWLFGLEVGYRFHPAFALAVQGQVDGYEPMNGFCDSGLSCKMGVATGGLRSISILDQSGSRVFWLSLEGGYRYFRLRRESMSTSAHEVDTTLSYHTLFGGGQLGVEWQDSYVADIRYGPYLGYLAGKAFTVRGHDDVDGVSADPGRNTPHVFHMIELGARLVFGL